MKKTISLLLTTLLIASLAIMPVSASTDEQLYPDNEQALLPFVDTALGGAPTTDGEFAGTNFTLIGTQTSYETSGIGVMIRKDDTDNVYFEIDADCTRTGQWNSHKLYIYDAAATSNSTKIKRFSAKVCLPETEKGETNLFAQSTSKKGDDGNHLYNTKALNSFGVQLKKGGAYYYDVDTAKYVRFIPDGTMVADKYYRVDAIMDARSMGNDQKVYMRAFIYDGEELVGESGWVYSYKSSTINCTTIIDAYNYSAGNTVLIDEFKIYRVDNIPTYTVTNENGENFTEGGVLPMSNYPTLTFTYSNPIPVAAVNSDNIKLCQDGIELLADMYTVSAGEEDANGNTTSFTVTMSDLSPETAYAIRLMAALSDYNESAASYAGIPADCGLYKDYAFISPTDPFIDAISSVVFTENEGKVSATTTISNTMLVDREYMFIITSWNKDLECVAIKNVYGTLAAGASAEVNLPEVAFEDAESTVCVYLVDNWYDMKPIGDPKVYKRS